MRRLDRPQGLARRLVAGLAAGYRGRGRFLPLVVMSLLLWPPPASTC
ncbi:hypothetical protein [Nocardioides endophyticus]